MYWIYFNPFSPSTQFSKFPLFPRRTEIYPTWSLRSRNHHLVTHEIKSTKISSTRFKMAPKTSRTCGFCSKCGHTEKKCWDKYPALKSAPWFRQLRTQGSPRKRGNKTSPPSQRLRGSLAATEQEQLCPLFKLPDELLLEIVSHLRTSSRYGHVYLQSLKSFSLVSKRARRVTMESLPLTVSCWCPCWRPFEQIITSKDFLGQIK